MVKSKTSSSAQHLDRNMDIYRMRTPYGRPVSIDQLSSRSVPVVKPKGSSCCGCCSSEKSTKVSDSSHSRAHDRAQLSAATRPIELPRKRPAQSWTNSFEQLLSRAERGEKLFVYDSLNFANKSFSSFTSYASGMLMYSLVDATCPAMPLPKGMTIC